jgi:hypothetical protein
LKAICIPTNDRPDLLAQCLDSIRAANGNQNWTLVFSCEPNQAVAELISRIGSWSIHFNRNPAKLGCRLNTFLAAAFANALGAELVLYLEDDCVISKDALLMADAFSESGKRGLLCLRRWHDTQSNDSHAVRVDLHGLLGGGMAYRPELFPILRKYWFYQDPSMGGEMWDWSVDWGLRRESISTWRPMINRSMSIGTIGTHSSSGLDLNLFGPCYEGCESQFVFQDGG